MLVTDLYIYYRLNNHLEINIMKKQANTMTQSQVNQFVDANLHKIKYAGDELAIANKLGVPVNMVREAYYTSHKR